MQKVYVFALYLFWFLKLSIKNLSTRKGIYSRLTDYETNYMIFVRNMLVSKTRPA